MSKSYRGFEILRHLKDKHTGSDNKVTSQQLCTLFEISGADLRVMFSHLRSSGMPICSDSGGYWYAKDADEIDATIAMYESRIAKMTEAVEGLEIAKSVVKARNNNSKLVENSCL